MSYYVTSNSNISMNFFTFRFIFFICLLRLKYSCYYSDFIFSYVSLISFLILAGIRSSPPTVCSWSVRNRTFIRLWSCFYR